MIRYALNCEQGHTFESWFQNSAAYDKQAKRGLVACPICGSAEVEEAIMAAAVSLRHLSPLWMPMDLPMPVPFRIIRRCPFRCRLKRRSRDVAARARTSEEAERAARTHHQNWAMLAPRFTEQARKIHYGEIEHRSIYGEASPDEAKELYEEGIEFHSAADFARRI